MRQKPTAPAATETETETTPPPAAPTTPPPAAAWDDDAGNVGITEEAAIRYPSIQIVNGDPRFAGHAREAGAFFMPEGQIDGGPLSVPGVCDWMPGKLVTKSGTKIPGSFAAFLALTLIRSRRSWSVGDGKIGARFAWGEYADAKAYGDTIGERPRSHVQGLAMIEGIGEPCAITFRGMHSAGLTARDAWADRVRRYVMAPASEIASKRHGRRIALPSLCFRVSLGFAVTGEGEPYYLTVGEGDDQSQITPVALIDPIARLTPEQIGAYYVGADARARNEAIYRDADPWIAEWSPEALRARREGRGVGLGKPPAPTRTAPSYRAEPETETDPADVF